jgi:hypothetical protein
MGAGAPSNRWLLSFKEGSAELNPESSARPLLGDFGRGDVLAGGKPEENTSSAPTPDYKNLHVRLRSHTVRRARYSH